MSWMYEKVKMNWMYEGEGYFCTVFPNDPDELPQDFPSMREAKEYGDENLGSGNYTIESPM